MKTLHAKASLNSKLDDSQSPGEKGLFFQHDYFTANIGQFKKHLSVFSGKPCRALEIGVHEGRCTTWMLNHILTHTHSAIDCLDYVENSNFWPNVSTTGSNAKVKFFKGFSQDILKNLTVGSYDFIYVDGGHDTLTVMEDSVLSFRLAKIGGIIAFDDYLLEYPPLKKAGLPKPALDFFMKHWISKIKILHKGYQIWIQKVCD